MTHGTQTMYKNKKCRCDECRLANTQSVKEWRMQKRARARQMSRVRSRMCQLSMVYVRENHPDVYKSIKAEAERIDRE